jgi:ribonuclease J
VVFGRCFLGDALLGTTTLTFYGGVNEVGGNKILLEDGETRVLLDFGMSFTLRNQYYSFPFLSPKNERELLELGILPKIRGAYEFEHSEPNIDAVFLSHSHMDHSAYISFLKRGIPIYCGETAYTILDAYSKVSFSGLEFNLVGLKFHTFRTGDKIKLGSLEIEPLHVDHSVPGSYGFIIHSSSGTVIYTGDFRKHGPRSDLTEDFVNKSAEAEPNVVISESTNMMNVEVSSEHEVVSKLYEIVRSTSGLVLANFACADMDRLRSFYKAAVNNGRKLVITLRQAYLLHVLSKDPHLQMPKIDEEDLLIFRRAKKKYLQWEDEIMKCGRVIDSREISKNQKHFILASSFYDLGELVEIRPTAGSCHILSASEPFNEETELDFNRLLNWLEHYGLPQYHVHVSGHITPMHLRETLKIMRPRRIFPIHGTHLELFQKFMGDLEGKVSIPEKDRTYRIS